MKRGKRSQIAIFVILALIIIAGIVGYFVLKDRIFGMRLPPEIQQVYDYYESCIESDTLEAAALMGSQAGYIEMPGFDAGSDYMPFSNQLDFLGQGVPYWYYVSGNNIRKEQVPSLELMEEQLEDYLEEEIDRCDFSQFIEAGYLIIPGNASSSVSIDDDKINIVMTQPLNITYAETSVLINNHKLEVESRLGEFYDIARDIYDYERDTLFLENYAVDNLRLYAPVDDFDLGCEPRVWYLGDIRDELQAAVQGNTMAIKVKGSYYDLRNEDNKYFVQDIGRSIGDRGEAVSFVYLEEFPFKLEVDPREGDFLIAEPVGNQPGLGALGFCFVAYHYVYDLAYPVVIQIYDGDELFMFPVAVVIDKNTPLEGETIMGLPDVEPELCMSDRRLSTIDVYTYNTNLEPVEADVDYKCFSTVCDIGKTTIQGVDAKLTAKFPQCVNGTLIAEAEGYFSSEEIISTVEAGAVDILMEKIYDLQLEGRIEGRALGKSPMLIHFQGEDTGVSVIYPEQTSVSLIPGEYNITAMVYEDSNINLASTTTTKCIDVPIGGVGALLGMTEEKCFDLEIPSQLISSALSAGGYARYYIGESELAQGTKIIIEAEDLGVPTSLEELEDNYNTLEDKTLIIDII